MILEEDGNLHIAPEFSENPQVSVVLFHLHFNK